MDCRFGRVPAAESVLSTLCLLDVNFQEFTRVHMPEVCLEQPGSKTASLATPVPKRRRAVHMHSTCTHSLRRARRSKQHQKRRMALFETQQKRCGVCTRATSSPVVLTESTSSKT